MVACATTHRRYRDDRVNTDRTPEGSDHRPTERLERVEETRHDTNRALHGLYRSLINNMVVGVSEQFKLTLNLQGVGYRAAVQGNDLVLNLGYSHQVVMPIPEGISVEVVKNTTINLTGCDKAGLGLFAAKVRAWRPPEPYKGKGIIYEGEIVKRKAGKSGK